MSIHTYPAGSAYPQLGLDPTLQALADLSTSADTAPYFTAVDQAALMTITPYARTLLDDVNPVSMQATLGLSSGARVTATGLASKVAVWSGTDTLTYDTLLHWDATNNRLGIGTDTPDYPLHVQGDSWLDGNVSIGTPEQTAPLTFGGVKGHKLHLYSDDPRYYGMAVEGEGQVYLPPDHLQIFVPKEAGNDTYIALGGYDTVAYAFEPRLVVQSLSGYVGIGTTTPTAPLTFSNALGPKIDLWSALPTSGRYGIGLQNSQMQIYSDPVGSVRLGRIDAAGTAFTSLFEVDVLNNRNYSPVKMGVAWGFVDNYELTTNRFYAAGSSLFAGVLQVNGNASLIGTYTGIGGYADSRWTTRLYGTAYHDGTVQFGSVTGFGVAPDASYWIRAGLSYFDSLGVGWGNPGGMELWTNRFYAAGISGIGRGAAAPWALCVGGASSLYADGGINADGLTVRGIAAVATGAQPGYYFSGYNIFSATNVYAATDVSGHNITARNNLSVYNVANIYIAPVAGFYLNTQSMYSAGDVWLGTAGRFVCEGSTYDGGSIYYRTMLMGNPNWAWEEIHAIHVTGSWAGFRMTSGATGARYDLHISDGYAYALGGAWVDSTSDRRVKTHITPIGDPLVHLMKLQGCYYDRTDRPAQPGFPAPQTLEYGLIAQDVAEALPEAAFQYDYGEGKEDLWNYTDRPVLALLVEAVKALAQRVETLEGA